MRGVVVADFAEVPGVFGVEEAEDFGAEGLVGEGCGGLVEFGEAGFAERFDFDGGGGKDQVAPDGVSDFAGEFREMIGLGHGGVWVCVCVLCDV